MSGSSDNMSFDDLSAIYRMERKTPAISAVRKDLYTAMANLLIGLRSEYERQLSKDPESLICEGCNQRRKRASGLAKEITEIRMGKVASMALLGARGGQNSLDALTSEEKDYYNDVLTVSRRQMELVDRLSGRKRFETRDLDSQHDQQKAVEKKAVSIEPAVIPPAETEDEPDTQDDEEEEYPPEEAEVPEVVAPQPSVSDDMVVIRVLEDLPPFSGPDRNYELSKEDVVRMPKIMAEALIHREKAVLINPAP